MLIGDRDRSKELGVTALVAFSGKDWSSQCGEGQNPPRFMGLSGSAGRFVADS